MSNPYERRAVTYQDQTRWIIGETHQAPGITPEALANLLVVAIQNYEPKQKDVVGADFLSLRELEVARPIQQTWPTDKEIATHFSISTATVKFTLPNIKRKIREMAPSAILETRIEFFTYLRRIIL